MNIHITSEAIKQMNDLFPQVTLEEPKQIAPGLFEISLGRATYEALCEARHPSETWSEAILRLCRAYAARRGFREALN